VIFGDLFRKYLTGKITDDDYGREVGPLRQAAAAALRALQDEPEP